MIRKPRLVRSPYQTCAEILSLLRTHTEELKWTSKREISIVKTVGKRMSGECPVAGAGACWNIGPKITGKLLEKLSGGATQPRRRDGTTLRGRCMTAKPGMQNRGDVTSERNLGERETNSRSEIGKTGRSNKPGRPTEQHIRGETTKKGGEHKKKPAIRRDDKGATKLGRQDEGTETGAPRPGTRTGKT